MTPLPYYVIWQKYKFKLPWLVQVGGGDKIGKPNYLNIPFLVNSNNRGYVRPSVTYKKKPQQIFKRFYFKDRVANACIYVSQEEISELDPKTNMWVRKRIGPEGAPIRVLDVANEQQIGFILEGEQTRNELKLHNE